MKRFAMLFATFLVWAAFGSLAYATVPEANAPKSNSKYFVIVKENDPAPSVDGKPRKIYKDPDVSKHGGKLLKKHDRTLVIELPSSSVDTLCADENVAYLQRIWDEDSTDAPSSDDLCPKAKKKSGVQSDSETNLTWETGQYLYDGSGNIKKIGDDVYTYDKAGRLVSAYVKGKTESYKYDSFGNLTEKTITGQAPIFNRIDGSSNRLVGETYDAAGALLTRNGATQYTYDSVGMVTMIRPPFQTGRRMIYGADDERVGELIGTNYSRWQFRDLQGRVLRDYKDDGIGYWLWSEDYIYGDGKLVAGEREDYHGGVRHYHLDHLGSTRMVTNSDRMRYGLHDYYPFGVEQTATLQEKDNFGSDRPGPKKFTGHERDFLGLTNVENTDYLDYMHARYYDPNVGRFLSVDPGRADVKKPQSWNRYAYVMNNPINNNDPDGRETNPVTGLSYIHDNQILNSASNSQKGHYGYVRNGGKKFHSGNDIAAPRGTPIFAPISGTVQTGYSKQGGHWLRITKTENGQTTAVHMSHLNAAPTVKSGDKVLEGQPNVGQVGNTGNASGEPPHVHTSVFINGNDREKNTVDPQQHFQNNPSNNEHQKKQQQQQQQPCPAGSTCPK